MATSHNYFFIKISHMTSQQSNDFSRVCTRFNASYLIQAMEKSTRMTCFYVEFNLKATISKLEGSPFFMKTDCWYIYPKSDKERQTYIEALLDDFRFSNTILASLDSGLLSPRYLVINLSKLHFRLLVNFKST